MSKIFLCSLMLVATNWLPAFASDDLSLPYFYGTALQDLPQDTAITRSNVAITSTKDSKQIPHRAVWFTSAAQAYGFRLRQPLHKGDPLSASAMYGANWNKFTPSDADPVWLKFAKSSIASNKGGDAKLGRQYRDSALAELDKMGVRKEMVQYMDQESMIIDMLHECDKADRLQSEQERAKQGGDVISRILQPDKLLRELEQQQAHDAEKDLVESSRIFKTLSAVLPPDSQEMGFAKDRLKSANERIKELKKSQ